MFKKIDTDNDGIVNIEDLKAGIHYFSSQLAEPEIQMLIEAVSILVYQSICPFLLPSLTKTPFKYNYYCWF